MIKWTLDKFSSEIFSGRGTCVNDPKWDTNYLFGSNKGAIKTTILTQNFIISIVIVIKG